MNFLEFLIRVLEVAASWPVVVLVIVIILRGKIGEFIDGIESGELKSSRLSVLLNRAKSSANAAAPSASRADDANPDFNRSTASPGRRILAAFDSLTSEMQAVAEAAGLWERGGRGRPPLPRALATMLRRDAIVDEQFETACRNLQLVRNNVLRGTLEPDDDQAREFEGAVAELVTKLPEAPDVVQTH